MEDLARRISSLSPEKRLLLELQLQRKRGLPEPIAIVGMACRLPAAPNLQAYWRLLTEGQDAIREVPADRWNVDAFYDADPQATGKTYCRWGGFLDGVDQFDPAFFGIAPREAPYIDPQQRLFLESVWEALEDAGIVPQTLGGQRVGVFAGASTLDYGQMLLQGPEVVGTYTATGLATTMVANRVSYLLNLQGPSLTVDTACSSSLVAVHLACQSLWNGESSLALAGGVNLMLTPTVTVGFSKLTALSPEGRCKTFDAAANGFVRSEGVGTVVLKRVSQALTDGDRIYALLRGSATNQDGRTNGLTAPNPAAQEAVVKAAYEQAGIRLNQVDYIEAHGTGTLLGDPIEAKALGNLFSPFRPLDQPVRLGSVKSNIGHTEAAAGIASLIKVALCLRHRTLVPSLHFHTPNPYIPFDQLPLRVQQQREPWAEAENMAIAGVSSFGFGGTNAHVALQAAPIFTSTPAVDRPLHVFCLSARSQPALQTYAQTMATALSQMPEANLGDICHTVNAGRTAFDHRLALLAPDLPTLITALQQPSSPPAPTHLHTGVVFLFTGQGSQYVGMGRQLYDTQPVFKATIDRCDELLQPYLDRSLQSLLFGLDHLSPDDFGEDSPTAPLHQTGYTQPALFAFEYALAQLWLSWGICPAAVMGHSVGEYVAACVAGVFSLEDGLRLMALRGRLMQTLPANGGMVAVFADADTVAAVLPSTVSLATLNGPDNTVIAGPLADLEAVVDDLHSQGIRTKPLQVSHAFHSALMDPILNVFEQSAQGISFHAPTIPLVSNLTGEFVGPDLPMDARYWRRHARQPVRFADAIATLHQAGHTLFLEVGPHPVLSAMGKRCVAHSDHTWLPSLRRGQADWHTLLTSLGHLYQRGLTIDWANFDRPYQRQWLTLPTYPFQRQRHWIDLALPDRPAPDRPAAVVPDDDVPEQVPSAAYGITWRPIALAPAVAGAPWLIWGASDALWGSLSQTLQKHGIGAIRVSAGDRFQPLQPDHYQVSLAQERPFEALMAAFKAQPVAHLLVLAPEATAGAPEGELDSQATTEPILHWVKELAQQPDPAKLWLITQGAQSVEASDAITSPQQAVLWGLGRTLRLEHPEFWGGLVDLPGAADASESAPWLDNLVAQVTNFHGEDEVALRQGQTWIPRLQTLDFTAASNAGAPSLQAEATYLITGGTGALGQQLAGWLVAQGARHLVLTGRRGPSAELEQTLAPLRQAGATVWVEAVDGGDRAALSTLLERMQQLPPLRGVFHAAGVLADGLVANQSTEQFHQVMPAKLQGAWHLHQLTQDLPLDWFVLFSSITSVLGSPGQGNYGAANAGLDALSQYRRQRGLPALSINWGPWQGAGMAESATALARRGMPALAAPEGLRWLGRLLTAEPPATVAIAHLDWPRLLRYLPTDRPPAIVSAFVTEGITASTGSGQAAGLIPKAQAIAPPLTQLLTQPEAQRVATVEAYLQTQVATVMGLSEEVPLDAPLMELGIDSLMTMELLALCKQDLDLVLYPREVLAHPTVAALSAYVAREMVRVHRPAVSVESDPALAAESLDEAVIGLPKSPWQAPAPLEPLPPRRNPPMVFLLSAPRSGSTLLRVMLAGHPGLFCPPELHLLPFNTLEAQGAALGYSYLQEGLQRAVMELLQVKAEQAEALLSDWRQHQTTVPAVYDKLQQMAEGRLLVDKSPTYSLSLETLERAEQMFEGAKYIHLVRHPYAVIESFVHNRMYKIFDLEPDQPYRLAEQVWQACNQNIRTFASTLNADRHYTLRYEDLVVDPEPAMRGLCAFLDLPFDPAVLTPYEGRRMTDGVTAQSMAVDDPNFRQRSRIEAHLAKIWQGIQLPHRLSNTSQALATQFDYPLPQEQETASISSTPVAEAVSLSPDYVPLGAMREEEILLRERPCCLCHWGPEDGPLVLCLHGILEHGAAWDGVATALADQGYHVIAPDLRGHGRSAHAGPDGGYQLLDFLGDLDRLTAALGAPVVLVGHSMGAVLGAILTSLRPERVQRLVLVEPVVPAPGPSSEPATQLVAHLDALANSPQPTAMVSVAAATQRLLALKPYLSQPLAEAMAQRLSQALNGVVVWRSDPRLQTRTTLSLSGGLLDRQGYGQILREIQRPTTVIFGQSSQFNRPEDLAFLQENLPQADQVSLVGGHDLPLETPGGLARVISESRPCP